MSDQTPSYQPPDAPGGTPADPTAPQEKGSGRGKKIAAGAGLATLVAVVGGGAFAYNELSGGGTQPADVLPASSDVMVRLDLDPSASQKVELFQMLNKFPEVGEALGIEDSDKADIRERVVDGLIAEQCDDIDYTDDVEPWIGDRIGMSAEVKDERFLIAVQVTDESKAKDGIDKLFDCTGSDYGIAFHEGYALISEKQGDVDDALDDIKEGTLADDEDYSNRIDQLGEQGIASMWADMPAMADLAADAAESSTGPGTVTEEQVDQLKELGTVAIALRAQDSAMEVAGIADESKQFDADKDAPSLSDLPSDTVIAATFSGVAGDYFSTQWETFIEAFDSTVNGSSAVTPAPIDEDLLEQMDPETRKLYEDLQDDQTAAPQSADEMIAQMEAESGLSIPEDIETLLSGGMSISVGEENLEELPTLGDPGDLSQLNLALRAHSDDSADVLNKLADWAGRYDVDLVVEESDGGAVLASSDSAAKALVDGGDLGGEDGVEAALPFGDDASQSIYVDADSIIEKLLDSNPPSDVEKVLEDLDSLQSVGVSGGNVDGASRFSFRIAFDD